MRWPAKASPATCDSRSSASWLRRDTVRSRLPSRDKRINDKRRRRQADEREAGVDVHEQARRTRPP